MPRSRSLSPFDVPKPKKSKTADLSKYNTDNSLHFNQPAYSDLTIKLDNKSIYCHKIIICTRSKYFRELCGANANFKVCDPGAWRLLMTLTGVLLKEKDQSVIELKDDDPDALEILLHWLYHQDYESIIVRNLANKVPIWRLHLNVALAADKYLCRNLEKAAIFALSEHLSSTTSSTEEAAQMLEIVHEMDLTDSIAAMTEQVQKRLLPDLLKEPQFRALLDRDHELRWKIIDGLASFQAALPNFIDLACIDCDDTFSWKKSAEIADMCDICRDSLAELRGSP